MGICVISKRGKRKRREEKLGHRRKKSSGIFGVLWRNVKTFLKNDCNTLTRSLFISRSHYPNPSTFLPNSNPTSQLLLLLPILHSLTQFLNPTHFLVPLQRRRNARIWVQFLLAGAWDSFYDRNPMSSNFYSFLVCGFSGLFFFLLLVRYMFLQLS